MSKLILILLPILISYASAAQYGDANHAANEGAIRTAQTRELNNTLNQIRDKMNSKPAAAGSYGANKPADPATQQLIDRELRKIFGKETAADRKYADSMAKEEKKQQQQAAELAAETRRWEYQRTFGERDRYAEKFYNLHKTGSLLTHEDLFELGYLDYLNACNKMTQGTRFRNIFTSTYNSSYTPSRYIASINSLSLDSALIHLRGCSAYTGFALKQIAVLRKKFPGNDNRIDSVEIELWPYYFGANRRYASYELESYGYAPCQYEMSPDDKRKASLDRVYELYEKYPEYTLKACGKVRLGFNPFVLMAKRSVGGPDAKFEFYKLALYSPGDHFAVTTSDDESQYYVPASYYEAGTVHSTAPMMSYIGNSSLREVADWLIENKPAYVKSLTKEDWKKICRMHCLSANYVAWAFRGGNYKKYKKNFTALHDLIKEEEKQTGYKDGYKFKQ